MKSNKDNYIKRLKSKKEDALEFIVDCYLPLVKATVHKVLSPIQKDELIDECINDIFLSIWNNSNKFTGEALDFKKWVYKIAKFKAIDYYRKAQKDTAVSLDNIDLAHTQSVEDDLILAEQKDELIKLLNTLDPIDKNIFTMKFFLGMKSDDIAEKLKMTRASIDNRVYRGKKKLSANIGNFDLEVAE
jgi:RNA polymerase sigma-70 factor (ECF subfamily)